MLNSAGVKLGNVLATAAISAGAGVPAAIRQVMHEATLEVSAMVRSAQIAALRRGACAEETPGHHAKQGARRTCAQMCNTSALFAVHPAWHSSRAEHRDLTSVT